jgi:predicted TIM-barrel fold metal-dependent hydrolase
MDYGRPIHLDEIAHDFPDLKIVASHAGWPWVTELVGVAWRNKNVFIETSAMRPKYYGIPGSGYETLLHFGNSVLKDKVIFGSQWPLLPLKRTIEEIQALPLKDEVKKNWLYKNGARVLGLD